MSTVDDILNNSVTQVPEQDAEEAKLWEDVLKMRISVNDEIEKEEFMLHNGEGAFFAKGDVSAIKSKPKQGKTNSIAAMVAAMLEGSWGPLTCKIEGCNIVWIDTEQRHGDAKRIYLRALKMAGLSMEDNFSRFQMFHLRSFMNDKKMESLKLIIKNCQPDIIFIDGIVDLINNFNDVEESKNIIDTLMRLSTKEESGKNIAIVCVLHTNKAAEDRNMRGHLGTMLTQKAGTVLEVKKNGQIFTVSNTESRNKEVPEWSFRFDDNGDIVDATFMVEQATKEQKEKREAEKKAKSEAEKQKLIQTMKDIIRKHGGKIERTIFRNELIEITGRALSTANGDIRTYINAGIIKQIQDYVFIADEAADSNQQNLPLL